MKIPAGVKDGSRIRLKGKGEAGWNGGPAGDLYVVTRVEPSKIFHRRGDDLLVDVHVRSPTPRSGRPRRCRPPSAATFGEDPGRLQDGKLLRVRGKGAPNPKGSGRGDLIARVKIDVPKKLSKKERELLEQLREARA